MIEPLLSNLWNQLGSQQATTLATVALLVLTGVYAWLTRKIANAMVKQQESLSRPLITANIDVSSQGLITLVLKNAGRSVASDIRLSIDRDFFCFSETKNLRDFPVFKGEPFPMGPGDAIRIALGLGHTLFQDAERTPPRFTVTAQYRFNAITYRETLPVDLTPYNKTTLPTSEFAIEMEKLRKAIEKLASR